GVTQRMHAVRCNKQRILVTQECQFSVYTAARLAARGGRTWGTEWIYISVLHVRVSPSRSRERRRPHLWVHGVVTQLVRCARSAARLAACCAGVICPAATAASNATVFGATSAATRPAAVTLVAVRWHAASRVVPPAMACFGRKRS